jgi:hypothetical protein
MRPVPNAFICASILACGVLVASSQATAQSVPSCTQTLTSGANVGSAITAAAAGSTICLSSGDYGGFTLSGVSKNPRVTVVAVSRLGASFTGGLVFTGGTNGLTLDGFNFRSISVTGASTRELTFRNYNQTGKFTIDGVTNTSPNILLEDFTHNNVSTSAADPARIHFSFSGRSTPVATIRRGTLDGGCSDGIQSGVPFIIESSRLMNMQVGDCPNDPHTDALQLYGGPYAGTIIRGNYFYRNVQVLTAFNGVDNVLIENNVLDPGPSGERRECQIEWHSDRNSIIRHNTIVFRSPNLGTICTYDANGTIIEENITSGISDEGGGFVNVTRSNNLLRSGTLAGNVTGSPTYVGGASPTSYEGFALASGSLGKGAGLKPAGSDIGANGSTFSLLGPRAPDNLRVD